MSQYRIEQDSMGQMQVPAEALYGAQTARAIENFPVSGVRFPRVFIKALGRIKATAASVNRDLGRLDASMAETIGRAAGEVADGRHDAHFPLDIFQTGSGTSTGCLPARRRNVPMSSRSGART
jgi:fumarate hydratase class II